MPVAQSVLPDLVVLGRDDAGNERLQEVCRKIRQDASLAHTGVVMLTGIGESLNETTSPLFGADEYVDKPFDFQSLDQKIKNVLASRAAQREAVPRPVGNGVGGPAKPAKAGRSKSARPTQKAKPAAVTKRRKQEKPASKAEKGKKPMAAKKHEEGREEKRRSPPRKRRSSFSRRGVSSARIGTRSPSSPFPRARSR